MFGFKYIKADPSTHLMLFKEGKIKLEGVGINFFYYAPSSSLVAIPSNSKELPFVFRLQAFGFEKTRCLYRELTIETSRHQYTPEYTELVKKFYLKM